MSSLHTLFLQVFLLLVNGPLAPSTTQPSASRSGQSSTLLRSRCPNQSQSDHVSRASATQLIPRRLHKSSLQPSVDSKDHPTHRILPRHRSRSGPFTTGLSADRSSLGGAPKSLLAQLSGIIKTAAGHKHYRSFLCIRSRCTTHSQNP